MSLSRLLLEVSPDAPRRREAWPLLYAELEALSREGISLPKLSRVLYISEQERPDIVNAVALKVLERSPLKVAGKGEGECRRYLLAMLRNHWIDEQRKRKRKQEEPLDGVPETHFEPVATEPEQHFSLPDARKLLDRVFQELYAQRAPRYRPELERAWKQQVSLFFDEASMDDILRDDEGVTASTPAAQRKAAQQRVHQNHSRLRKSLSLAVADMLQRGLLSPEDGTLAQRLIGELNRCQKISSVDVPRSES